MGSKSSSQTQRVQDILDAMEMRTGAYVRNIITMMGTVIVSLGIIIGGIYWIITSQTEPINKRLKGIEKQCEQIKSDPELKSFIGDIADEKIDKHIIRNNH